MRILIGVFIFCALFSNAQDSLSFQVKPSDEMRITECKYYISHLTWYKNGDQLFADTSAHLIQSLDTIIFTDRSFHEADSISFLLGVDSLHNVGGVFGGELDPTNGMYWAWQSGFINVKLEGNLINSDERMELHLGGYMSPYVAAQTIGFPLTSRCIEIKLKPLIDFVIENKMYRTMSPGEKAVQCSKKLAEGIACKNI